MANGKQRRMVGTIIYWVAMLLALFGLISTIMSVALFEGGERLWGTLSWAGFTAAALVVSYTVRKVLMK